MTIAHSDVGRPTRTLHVTLSGDIFLKSRRTQKGLVRRVRANLESAIRTTGRDLPIARIGSHRYEISVPDHRVDAVGKALSTVFGVASVDSVVEVPFSSLESLVETVAASTASRVDGHTFAVRAKRRGSHDWNSMDIARALGTELVAAGGQVDLTNPEVTVSVTVLDDRAFIVDDHVAGAAGLPVGTQDRVLCLLSGGFDSVVAAWMMMSRGCRVDFVHFTLNCAQSDHALAVGRELWQSWGHGSDPDVHLVEFQPVKDALFEHVDPRMRQVALKVMMARAASWIAQTESIPALVTGDSLGQVSSQTLPHLVAVSEQSSVPILRPLVGLDKESIITLARRVGTAELSARAQEVCDLSEGQRVATSATSSSISMSTDQIPDEILTDMVGTRKTFKLADWTPGQF